MLQDMDHMERSCIVYVKVGTHNQLEQSKICVLTITPLGIAMLTVHHYMMYSLCVKKDPRDFWDKHQQTSLPSKNVLCISHKHLISAVFHLHLSLRTHTQPWANLLQLAGPLETRATCSYPQQDISFVERASWLFCIPFWHEDNYIVLRTSHFISLSTSQDFPLLLVIIISLLPRQQIMAAQTLQQGGSESESSRTTSASSNTPPAVNQLQSRNHFVHRDTPNAATEDITLEKQ